VLANLDLGKLVVLLAVGLVVLGPERLPKMAADAGRLLRALRRMAQDATGDLREELAPHLGEFSELELSDLHPRRLLDRYLQAEPVESQPQGRPSPPVPHPAGSPDAGVAATGEAVGAGQGGQADATAQADASTQADASAQAGQARPYRPALYDTEAT
jgi:sec-independent protein translocase protein TatB